MLAIAAALVLAVGASLFLLRSAGDAAADDGHNAGAWRAGLRQRGVRGSRPRRRQGAGGDRDGFPEPGGASEATNTVDPKTAAALKKNLLVMNEAINETRKALDVDPQSAPARASLYEVLKQKIQFLQDTIALMNEMRQGDAAGAAEIVESGKS